MTSQYTSFFTESGDLKHELTTSSTGSQTFSVNTTDVLTLDSAGISVAGATDATSFSLSGSAILASSLTSVTPGTGAASKALVLGANRDITNINNLSTTGSLSVSETTSTKSIKITPSTISFGPHVDIPGVLWVSGTSRHYGARQISENQISLLSYSEGGRYTDMINLDHNLGFPILNISATTTKCNVLEASNHIKIGTSTDTTKMISALDGITTAGSLRSICFGSANTAGNQAELTMFYQGDNNDINRLSLGFHTQTAILNVLNSKRVGINTLTPQSVVHAVGLSGLGGGGFESVIRLASSTNDTRFDIRCQTTLGPVLFGTTSDSDLIFRTNDTTKMTLTKAGFLGIGVTTPTTALDVNGSIKVRTETGPAGISLISGDNSAPFIILQRAVADDEFRDWRITNNGGRLHFASQFQTTPYADQMVLQADGNLRIGLLTETTHKLDVGGTANATGFSLGGNAILASALTGVTAGTGVASKALVLDTSRNVTNINSLTATSLSGTIQTASQPNITSVGSLTGLTVSGTINATEYRQSGSVVQFGVISGVTAGTATASKALVLDASRNISNIGVISSTIANDTTTHSNIQQWTNDATADVSVALSMSNATAIIGTTTNHGFDIATNGVSRIGILSSGNVGMGISNPTSRLHISGNSSSAGGGYEFAFRINESSNASVYEVRMGSSSNNTILLGATTNSHLGFRTNNTTRMTLSAAGLVGIGTTTPTQTLDVNGTINATSIIGTSFTPSTKTISTHVDVPNVVWYSTQGRNYGMRHPSDDTNLFSLLSYSAGGNYDDYIVWNHNSGNPSLQISASVNTKQLTIGPKNLTDTDSSSALCALNGVLFPGSNYRMMLGSTNTGGNAAEIYFRYIGSNSASNALTFGFHSNTDVLSVWNDDSVTRSSGSTTFDSSSDMRVKQNIVSADLSICYDNVKNLRLTRFNWTDEYRAHENVSIHDNNILGWIAQEVEQVFPKSVRTSAKYGYEDFKTIQIDEIIKTLYGCVQKVIIDKESIEQKNQDLEARLKRLEDMMASQSTA